MRYTVRTFIHLKRTDIKTFSWFSSVVLSEWWDSISNKSQCRLQGDYKGSTTDNKGGLLKYSCKFRVARCCSLWELWRTALNIANCSTLQHSGSTLAVLGIVRHMQLVILLTSQLTGECDCFKALGISNNNNNNNNVKVRNILHGRNNITCSINCKYGTAATLYTLQTWFVSGV